MQSNTDQQGGKKAAILTYLAFHSGESFTVRHLYEELGDDRLITLMLHELTELHLRGQVTAFPPDPDSFHSVLQRLVESARWQYRGE